MYLKWKEIEMAKNESNEIIKFTRLNQQANSNKRLRSAMELRPKRIKKWKKEGPSDGGWNGKGRNISGVVEVISQSE